MENGGTYILIFYFKKSESISVGSMGEIQLKKGYYAYVGSALGKYGIYNRVGRHIRKNKKLRWHIDYLKAQVKEVWLSDDGKRHECTWAKNLFETSDGIIKGFGASDCKCKSHLLYFKNYESLKKSKLSLLYENDLKSTWRKIPFNLAGEDIRMPKVSYLMGRSINTGRRKI